MGVPIFRLLACAAAVWACPAQSPVAAGRPDRVPEGYWRGEQAQLTVAEQTATVEFTCAHGTLTVPLDLDSEGRFDVAGTYLREGPGPSALDEKGEAARYLGRVDGAEMTFKVNLVGSKTTLGPYTVTLNRKVRFIKCQ